MSKEINILWTGGWDSTFRIIQLAKNGSIIQPYYVIDTNRISTIKEIKSIYSIKNELAEKYPNSFIKDIIFIEISTLKITDEYQESYKKLTTESFIGSQYLWLSILAKKIPKLELCIHEDDKAAYFAKKIINKKGPNSDISRIFGSFSYPILSYTKLQMKKEALVGGDLDILCKSWFCHTPINDTPCGFCNPCLYSLQEGMADSFTLRGKIYSKFPRVMRKLRALIKKVI